VVVAVDIRSARDRLDLARRLSDTPASATVRGVWFSMAADHVQRMGRAETVAWRTAVRTRRRFPFLSYSLREYLEELAVAAAIVDPMSPGDGIRQIWRRATSSYVATPFGRSLIRLIGRNPLRYLGWLAEHRDHFCNYGEWRLVPRSEGYAVMEMKDEFIWIEHAHCGGAEGLLETCGVKGTVESELVSPYHGRMHVRWEPHHPS